MEEGSPQVSEVVGAACGQVKTGIVCVASVYVCICVYVARVRVASVCLCVCTHGNMFTCLSVCVYMFLCVGCLCMSPAHYQLRTQRTPPSPVLRTHS